MEPVTTVDRGADVAEKTLAHVGVKGMKWGVRNKGLKLAKSKKIAAPTMLRQADGSYKISIESSELKKAKPGSYLVMDKGANERMGFAKREDGNWEHRFTVSNNTPEAHIAATVAMDRAHLVSKNISHADVGQTVIGEGEAFLFEFEENSELAHVGVKGMKWGVRRNRVSSTSTGSNLVVTKTKPSEDFAKVSSLRSKPSSALSNQELQALITRIDLEKRYVAAITPAARPSVASRKSKVAKFVSNLLLDVGKQQIRRVAREAGAQAVNKSSIGKSLGLDKKKEEKKKNKDN